MRTRILTIIGLVIASHCAVSAKKQRHRSGHHQHSYASRTHSKKHHRVHEIKDPRPEMTMDDVKAQEHPWGIDVSHYQANIDWVAMAEEKPNFMFIKASEGIDIKDGKYAAYYTEARKLGIPVGSYHFFSYKSPGKDQAENFLAVAQHAEGDLLPVLDAEYTRSTPRDPMKVTSELVSFVSAVYEKLGRYPIIYCNYRYAQTFLTDALLQKCKLWIVDYKNRPECDWTLWQTTNKFKLASIKGHVDLNFLNGEKTTIQDLFFKTNKDG